MKIIKLFVKNIRKIKAFEINTDGEDLIEIGGENESGKTSAIESIAEAVSGKKTKLKKPIRKGENDGEILVSLDNGFNIKKHFYYDDNKQVKIRLILTDSNNNRISTTPPELASILNSATIDVLEFARYDEKKQLETLKEITGCDTSTLDSEYKTVYTERTFVNREKDSAKKQMDAIQKVLPEKVPDAESLAELYKKKQVINDHNRTIEIREAALSSDRNLLQQKVSEIASIKKEIEKLTKRSDKLSEEIDALYEKLSKEDEKVLEKKDTKEIDEKIKEVEANQSIILKARQLEDHKKAYEEKKSKSDSLTKRLEDIKEEKIKMIQTAKMPIKELSFDSDGLYYKGVPFSQLSSEEKIRVSMAISMAANPKLKVLYIKDGSLLDSKKLEIIKSMAKEKDYQIWIEKVMDEPDGDCIYMEDGEIKSKDEKFNVIKTDDDELMSILGM